MNQELINWIASQQDSLDTIIADTADEYFALNNSSRSNFIYDVQEAAEEMYQLGRGKDLCYDRPCIGFVYSLWYHGRRINTFIKYFTKAFTNTKEEHIEIFDLGAGTGAVQWAIGIVYAGMKILNIATPRIRIVNIDNSPFMLQYHNLLWDKFRSHYTQCLDIDWEYKLNSWSSSDASGYTNPWICASYLFDTNENREAISNDFIELIQKYEPNTILLLTSDQPEKREHLQTISSKIQGIDYKVEQDSLGNNLFEGTIIEVNQCRDRYRKKFNIKGFNGKASWNDKSLTGMVFISERIKQLSLTDLAEQRQNIERIDLYNPPNKLRRQIKLTEEQKAASKHSERATIITGSAGSGKSVVITERIKNLVEKENYSQSLKILLTTFNKGLIGQLGDWLEQVLDSNRCRRQIDYSSLGEQEETSKFYFNSYNTESANIVLMHFDVLPTRIGKIKGTVPYEKYYIDRLEQVIIQVRKDCNLQENKHEDLLNSDFLLNEFHRVFYGLEYRTKETYLNGERKGRGKKPQLEKNSPKREMIFDCLENYYNLLCHFNIHEFTRIRLQFLDDLRSNKLETRFTHIFVDEYQDCTKADFQILYQLLQNPDHLIIAGDLAQSVHLGQSYGFPKPYAGMQKRKIFRLGGSHRLPYRISECIKELPKIIIEKHKNTSKKSEVLPNEIIPYKGSPPGARPIVVFGTTVELISQKIKEIFETYRDGYGLDKITILEKDKELCSALRQIKINVETDTILRLKGLEKECVLWSVRTSVEEESEAEEFVYTILTRTSSILIIALSGKISSNYQKIIGTLNRDRLIFWDEETKERYSEFCRKPDLEDINDNVDDE